MTRFAILGVLLLAACASGPPPPDWQPSANAALDAAVAAHLNGDTRIEMIETERLRRELARTGRADLLARAELKRCAARVASLVFEPCAAFEAHRADAAAPELAYAEHLAGRAAPADVARLPEPQRAAALATAESAPAALKAIDDPLARLVAAGVLFERERAAPEVIAIAVDTASAQGWRRPLLAWLRVQLARAEAGGASDEAERLRRRIALVEERR